MLRKHFPKWLKSESTEFALEMVSGVLFGAALFNYLF